MAKKTTPPEFTVTYVDTNEMRRNETEAMKINSMHACFCTTKRK